MLRLSSRSCYNSDLHSSPKFCFLLSFTFTPWHPPLPLEHIHSLTLYLSPNYSSNLYKTLPSWSILLGPYSTFLHYTHMALTLSLACPLMQALPCTAFDGLQISAVYVPNYTELLELIVELLKYCSLRLHSTHTLWEAPRLCSQQTHVIEQNCNTSTLYVMK